MEHGKIPVCYFPTKIMFVDDNQRFLKNISFKIDEDQSYVIFDNPTEALSYLQKEYAERPNMGKFSVNADSYESLPTKSVFSLDISRVVHEALNPKRFDEISVLIIDYSMPTMNGLEFCEKIKNLPIKKILVTGEADESLAVKAFNQGTIDKFILKSNPDFDNTLNTYIRELQQAYFLDTTKKISDVLFQDPMCCLKNKALIDEINKLVAKHNIVEFYLLDTTGSLLMLDKDGKPLWFIVQGKEDRQVYLDFIGDAGASKTLVADLEQGKKIAYHPNIDQLPDFSGDAWNNITYSAVKLPDGLAYALIDKMPSINLDTKHLLSYDDYLASKGMA